MTYQSLIDSQQLSRHLTRQNWVVIDCRFSLADTERGATAYREAHIPGACYAHLDLDLSGPLRVEGGGRHPLPDIATFADTLGRWGVDASVQVVAYDDMGGAIAARLWWMLRWLGHDAVAVLDGGWPAWSGAGLATESGETRPPARRHFQPKVRSHLSVDAAEVNRRRTNADWSVLDARGGDRYRGEHETIDPVAGHIPGALSAPFAQNLGADGRFLPIEALKSRFKPFLEEAPIDQTIVYCGSGVTAAHNLLAMAHAGLGDALLYPGSWSEWIQDPSRPVATGDSVYGEGP